MARMYRRPQGNASGGVERVAIGIIRRTVLPDEFVRRECNTVNPTAATRADRDRFRRVSPLPCVPAQVFTELAEVQRGARKLVFMPHTRPCFGSIRRSAPSGNQSFRMNSYSVTSRWRRL